MSTRLLRLAVFLLFAPAGAAPGFAQEVNLYTHREPGLIRPLLERFTAETGVKVNVVFAGNGLAERIQSEGERSPADLLLSVDVATLTQAVALGITQPVLTPVLDQAVPANLHAPDGAWWGISLRARVFYVSRERVQDATLTYEDLADPRFRGRVCSRDGLHPYNTALFGAVIAHLGEAGAENWLRGVRENLAKRPSGGDRDVAKDIAAGLCDIGLANSYYIGLMRADANQKAWAEAVRVVLPTFRQGGGTHVNVSGLVFARYMKNRENAIRLAEWLVSPAAQAIYARLNFEYPVAAGIEPDAFLRSIGTLTPDPLPLALIGAKRKAASELVDKVGFNLGPPR